ncbi:MAG: 16S rRNA (cytosine(967)-C(5))-methyltransferase RsmB [Anaerolineaceae bacterium]|nr:MAG: 16S rRNA (cytosine(967)-C(5))-methyltransferase RsmB [Anaerolineaceae bacterium]
MTNHDNEREIVLDMLIEVIEGEEFSHRVLGRVLKHNQDRPKQERAFISRLFTGTVKRYLTLDYVIDQFSSLPIRKMKPLIRNLLRLSVYQLLYMDSIPASAVCNEAVKLAKKRGFSQLSGFVNANLRNIARMGDIKYPDKARDIKEYLSVRYSTPLWLLGMLLDQYDPVQVETILEASLREKEITIRCNRMKTTPDELKEKLIAEGVTVTGHPYLKEAFVIKDFDYLEGLDTFNEGLFAVQDVSSMLVGEVSGVKKDDYVVDVCAAPGGKALQIAEKAGKVSARDLTEYKTKLIEENILRMGVQNIETKVWDATIIDSDIINKADVVIADLPCSGLGVIGKKYDIKYKLTQNQQKELVTLQREILNVVSRYVKPGGILIYSTCTLNRDENIGNMEWFLANHDFTSESLNNYLPGLLHSDTTGAGYLQLLQGIHPTDGFFICRMRKGK